MAMEAAIRKNGRIERLDERLFVRYGGRSLQISGKRFLCNPAHVPESFQMPARYPVSR